jgi:phage gpG-like protein
MTQEEFERWLERAGERLETGDYQPGLQLLKPIARQQFNRNFATASTADGRKWPPRKDKKKHPLLILTGKMKNSIVVGDGGFEDRGPNHLTLGIDSGSVPYASIHNDGGTRMPQRAYAEVNDPTVDEMDEVFTDWVLNNMILGE